MTRLHIGTVDITIPALVPPVVEPTVHELTDLEYRQQRARVADSLLPHPHCEHAHRHLPDDVWKETA